jgi:hypothetical protein
MNKTKSRKSLKRFTSKNKHCDDQATMYGLHVWYKSMFEKLGWMVLAHSKGYMKDKVNTYIHSVIHLKNKIECKMNNIHDLDNKEDLKIMYANVCILLNHIKKDFN